MNQEIELKGTVKTQITPLGLAALLQLPAGVSVRQMHYDFDTDTIQIRLESVDFPFRYFAEGELIADPWVMARLVQMEDGIPRITWDFPKHI